MEDNHIAFGFGITDDYQRGEGIRVGNRSGDGSPFGYWKGGIGQGLWGQDTLNDGFVLGEGHGKGYGAGRGGAIDNKFLYGR